MIKHLNSLHIWLCTQPPGFDLKSIKSLTPAQLAEGQELGETTYFGIRRVDCSSGWTLDRNLPLLDPQDGLGHRRRIFLTETPPPTARLGRLDRLPLEIINAIISLLDIAAVDQLKVVNRRAFAVANSHPQFKFLNWEAHDTLRGVRAIKISHTITVQALLETLYASQCVECGEFGGYMYLVTFERVCRRCFEKKDRYSPLREIAALKKFGLTPEILGPLPRFQSYPGSYGDAGFFIGLAKLKNYIPLVDRESAYRAGITQHGSQEAMHEFVAKADPNIWKFYEKEIDEREKKHMAERVAKWRKDEARWKAYTKRQNADKRARREERERRKEEREKRIGNAHGRPGSQIGDDESRREDTDNESISTLPYTSDSDQGSDKDSHSLCSDTERREREARSDEDSDDDDLEKLHNRPLRYMALMRVPWLNRRTQKGEWGFHCVACLNTGTWRTQYDEPNDYDWGTRYKRDFIMSAFSEHLKEYGPVRDGVHHRNGCCEAGWCKQSLKEDIEHRPFWRA
jgi:hypothetical protein